jgi:hypothetical protein
MFFWRHGVTPQAFASRAKIGDMKAAMFLTKRIDPQLLESYRSQSGLTIYKLSQDRPLLLVFLRHFG